MRFEVMRSLRFKVMRGKVFKVFRVFKVFKVEAMWSIPPRMVLKPYNLITSNLKTLQP